MLWLVVLVSSSSPLPVPVQKKRMRMKTLLAAPLAFLLVSARGACEGCADLDAGTPRA